MLTAAKQLIRNRKLLFRHENIFLFSHMRANTSLFGHILGSHPEIEGYYEMHIGYYSWRSLWRQKLIYMENHTAKPTSHIFFDKLLHEYCRVSPEILARPETKSIFMLRQPEQSIKSIISLYQKTDPSHAHAKAEGATHYYVSRIAELADIAGSIKGNYYYLDAEDLVETPDKTLDALGTWLELKTPLSSEYKIFNKTGAPQAGDSSERIKSGGISKTQSDYADILLSPAALAEAKEKYQQTRSSLIEWSCNRNSMSAPPAAIDTAN